jgi:hypothetical protein
LLIRFSFLTLAVSATELAMAMRVKSTARVKVLLQAPQ